MDFWIGWFMGLGIGGIMGCFLKVIVDEHRASKERQKQREQEVIDRRFDRFSERLHDLETRARGAG